MESFSDYRKDGTKVENKKLLFEYYYRSFCIEYYQDYLDVLIYKNGKFNEELSNFADQICNSYSATAPFPSLGYRYVTLETVNRILKILKTNKIFVKCYTLANKIPHIVKKAKKNAEYLVKLYYMNDPEWYQTVDKYGYPE